MLSFLLNVPWFVLGGLVMGLRWRTELKVFAAAFVKFIND